MQLSDDELIIVIAALLQRKARLKDLIRKFNNKDTREELEACEKTYQKFKDIQQLRELEWTE